MQTDRNLPLIVQRDGSILLDLDTPQAEEARAHLASFAELVSSPEHIHNYRISNLSLWNAASAGIDLSGIKEKLQAWSRYPVPAALLVYIADTLSRWGAAILKPGPLTDQHILELQTEQIADELAARRELHSLLIPHTKTTYLVAARERGNLKQKIMKAGYPVKDEIPLMDGSPCEIKLNTSENFYLRDYQSMARDCFIGGRLPGNGYGVLVLPCGAGKTVIGMASMAELGFETLILCPNVSAIRQWKRELLAKTNLSEDQVGEYSGEHKELKPVTIASYQILTWRAQHSEDFPHFALFGLRNWGLIIYDEVHLLPAPVFRMTAEIQSKHRLGLTATLVREDGLETDVFSLVGPKRYDVPWKVLESAGWIARAVCTEFKVSLDPEDRRAYLGATTREQNRIASCSKAKFNCVEALIHKHADEQILIIGQYLDQLKTLANQLKLPLITGSMPNLKRDELYDDFRSGKIRVLVVSKVANFAIDLPDASVAIQISGTFGSRQEEAQRLGRIMRPKERSAHFYTLVSRMTVEEEFSQNRQRFLGEQGYAYQLEFWDDDEVESKNER